MRTREEQSQWGEPMVRRIEALVEEAGGFGAPSNRMDVEAVYRALHVEIITMRGVSDPKVFGIFFPPERPNVPLRVAIHEKYVDDPVARREILLHELGHVIAWLLGVPASAPQFKLPQLYLNRCNLEVMSGQFERVAALPMQRLDSFLQKYPRADNFLVASEFGVTLDTPPQRVAELLCSTYTSDPRMPVDRVTAFLRRCETRVQLLASGKAEEYLDRDPAIRADLIPGQSGLLHQIEDLLATRSPDGVKAVAIAHLLRTRSTADVSFTFEHLPLEMSSLLLRVMETLQPPARTVAKAMLLLKLNRPTQALELLREDPLAKTNFDALWLMALAVKKAFPGNGLQLAEAYARQALQRGPESEETRFLLVNILIGQRRFLEAALLLDDLEQDDGGFFRTSYYRAKMEEALKHFERALALYHISSGGPTEFSNKARIRECMVLVALNRLDEAEAKYRELVHRAPYHVKALRQFVELLARRGKREQAVDYVLQLSRYSPLQSWCYSELASLYDAEGRPELAEPMRRHAVLLGDITKIHEAAAREWKLN